MNVLNFENVQAALASEIQPTLESHGGSIVLESVEGSTIRVSFRGQCAACPALGETIEHLVETRLQELFPQENIHIIAVQGVSEDLISMARQILRKKDYNKHE